VALQLILLQSAYRSLYITPQAPLTVIAVPAPQSKVFVGPLGIP